MALHGQRDVEARENKTHTGKPNGFPSSVCTRLFSKQLDSDRRAAYVPENAGAGSTPGRNKTQSDV